MLNEQGENVYWAITHADGFYRDVFKKFKGMFERIFITGVSPVTLDDVTSGFNIGWHSYILELKVLSKKDYESKPEDGKLSKAETQWQEAEEQINRYAAAPRVEALRQGTTLHKIIMQFVAGKLVRMEEVVC